jgi:hypothetical protein
MNRGPAKPFTMRDGLLLLTNGVVAGRYERRVKRTIGPSPTETSLTTKPGARAAAESGRIPKPNQMRRGRLQPKMFVPMPFAGNGPGSTQVKAHALRPDQPQALRCRWR